MRIDNRTLPVLLFLLLGCAALALTFLTGAHKDAAFHATAPGRSLDQDPTAPSLFPLRVGTPAPDLPLLDRDGGTYRLSQFRGRRVLLAFFRDSPDCVRFAPKWEKLNRRSPEVMVLGISTNGPGDVDRFRRATKVTFPLLFDRDYDRDRLDEHIQCPSSAAIDEDGIIVSLSGTTDAQEDNPR
jgi:peroxiredoxin